MAVLVTGAAGFIGFHVSKALLGRDERVIGIDNLNDYYDASLKQARLDQLTEHNAFEFHKADISNKDAIDTIFHRHEDEITSIIHLAAQAGVRHSLANPYVYVQSNVMGQVVLLEAAKLNLTKLKHFVYASSSSVYGSNAKQPFSVDDPVEKPVSLYAATKRADELITRAYSHLWQIPATGLRFFTVYGPWGRPDMAAFLFADAITRDEPIKVFNRGEMRRDFTYIDDIVTGVLGALDNPPAPDNDNVRHRVYNLGNSCSEKLMDFISVIEQELGKKAKKYFLPMQAGDVPKTYADITASIRDLNYNPTTTIEAGIPRFIQWYREYYGLE